MAGRQHSSDTIAIQLSLCLLRCASRVVLFISSSVRSHPAPVALAQPVTTRTPLLHPPLQVQVQVQFAVVNYVALFHLPRFRYCV